MFSSGSWRNYPFLKYSPCRTNFGCWFYSCSNSHLRWSRTHQDQISFHFNCSNGDNRCDEWTLNGGIYCFWQSALRHRVGSNNCSIQCCQVSGITSYHWDQLSECSSTLEGASSRSALSSAPGFRNWLEVEGSHCWIVWNPAACYCRFWYGRLQC